MTLRFDMTVSNDRDTAHALEIYQTDGTAPEYVGGYFQLWIGRDRNGGEPMVKLRGEDAEVNAVDVSVPSGEALRISIFFSPANIGGVEPGVYTADLLYHITGTGALQAVAAGLVRITTGPSQ